MTTEGTEPMVGTSSDGMRLLWSRADDPERWRYEIDPRIIPGEGSYLLVCTHSGQAPPGPGWSAVEVEVIASGGQVVAQAKGAIGEILRFPSGQWREGAYEVRWTTAAPNGEHLIGYLPWYKGDLLGAARALVARAAQADRTTPSGLVHAMLADIVTDRLGEDLGYQGDDLLQRVHSPLIESEELELERTTGTGLVRPNGFVRLAYRDRADGGPMFCRAYLPRHYDPAKKWPMMVSLHGFNFDNPPYVRWSGVDQRHDPNADYGDLIVLYPHARLAGWVGSLSERDALQRNVLHCIELAKQRFPVDDDRLYLRGYSMGGIGAWHLGTRHPELFAALAPVYGAWDYRVFPKADDLEGLSERARFRLERCSSFAQAEALLHTPVFMVHGDADEVVSVDLSRYATRMLQRWGYPVRYWEQPGGGHGVECEDVLLSWFLTQRRERDPRRVRVRAAELRSATAHWVQIEQRVDPLAFMLADAEIMGPNTIRLDTENVAGISLSPRGSLVDPSKPLEVIWNGTDRRVSRFERGRVTLWIQGYACAPGELCKRPGLEGPISDVINTPFAIVCGTMASDPAMRQQCEQAALALRRHWEGVQHWSPRHFRDTEISEADLAEYSLILIGGPDDNLVVQELREEVPLTIYEDKIVLDGRSFEARDAVVQLIYPHPLNPDRCVVITAANSAEGMSLAVPHPPPTWINIGNMPLIEHVPEDIDFVIADGRVVGEQQDGRGQKVHVIASGVFDHRWRLQEELLVTQ